MIDGKLSEYIKSLGRARRIDGEHDCCTFPANWAVFLGYQDPMKAWRFSYSTENEAMDIIHEAGGLVKLFSDGMKSANISPRYGEPLYGDIGVIKIGEHEAGAIFSGQRWAIVAERGIAFVSIDPDYISAIWALNDG